MEILTPRLVLRPVTMEDAPDIQQAKEEVWPELQKWMSWAHDEQKGLGALHDVIRATASTCPLAIVVGRRRDNGAYVVSTGLNPVADEPGAYVTGYWVAAPQLGQGFATEATNAMIRYAFGALDASAVLIDYYEGNEKSARIIRKLGFTPERTDREAHARCLDGMLLDVHKFRRVNADGLPPLDVAWHGAPPALKEPFRTPQPS